MIEYELHEVQRGRSELRGSVGSYALDFALGVSVLVMFFLAIHAGEESIVEQSGHWIKRCFGLAFALILAQVIIVRGWPRGLRLWLIGVCALIVLNSMIFLPSKHHAWLINGQLHTTVPGFAWTSAVALKIPLTYRTDEYRPYQVEVGLENGVSIRTSVAIDLRFVPSSAEAARRVATGGELALVDTHINARIHEVIEWAIQSEEAAYLVQGQLEVLMLEAILEELEGFSVYGTVRIVDEHPFLGGVRSTPPVFYA